MNSLSNMFDNELNIKSLAPISSEGIKQVKIFHCRKGMREYCRLFYIKSGELRFYKPNTTDLILTANVGDVVYLPTDIEYDSVWQNENDIDFVAILYNLNDSQNNPVTLYNKLHIMTNDKNKVLLKSFEKLNRIFNEGNFGYKLICRSILWQILYDILSVFTKQKYENRNDIYKGIFYIENNFSEEISVDDIAKKCNMCPSSFRKKFKEIIGMSPIEYKNYLKTKKAIELLSFGEFNVSEISDIVGFSDVVYFCRQFKRFWGTTPKKYIEQHDKENNSPPLP